MTILIFIELLRLLLFLFALSLPLSLLCFVLRFPVCRVPVNRHTRSHFLCHKSIQQHHFCVLSAIPKKKKKKRRNIQNDSLNFGTRLTAFLHQPQCDDYWNHFWLLSRRAFKQVKMQRCFYEASISQLLCVSLGWCVFYFTVCVCSSVFYTDYDNQLKMMNITLVMFVIVVAQYYTLCDNRGWVRACVGMSDES